MKRHLVRSEVVANRLFDAPQCDDERAFARGNDLQDPALVVGDEVGLGGRLTGGAEEGPGPGAGLGSGLGAGAAVFFSGVATISGFFPGMLRT